MHRLTVAAWLVLALAGWSVPASADELADFEQARRFYKDGEYRKAVNGFESLVGGEIARAKIPLVIQESRKYLGASYLFVGNEEAARQQFKLLLEEDPGYQLDSLSFPRAVLDVFAEMKLQVQARQTRQRRERERREAEQRKAEMKELLEQQERIKRLEELAATETVEKVNSRWIAILPFGVGQFQNGDKKLGIFFATTESALLVASITTAVVHNSLRSETVDPDRLQDAQRAERALRISNWAVTGALVGVYLAGLIHAEVKFKPKITRTRERELPEDLRSKRSLELQLGIGGGSVRYRF